MYTNNSAALNLTEMEQDICNFVEDLMLALSFRNSLIGGKYLRDCIVEVCLAVKKTITLSDDIYPIIANRYNTIPANVCKAIRHCLITCYNDGTLKRVNRIFRFELIGNAPPTNAEFIKTIAIFVKRYLRAREDEKTRFTYFSLPQ